MKDFLSKAKVFFIKTYEFFKTHILAVIVYLVSRWLAKFFGL